GSFIKRRISIAPGRGLFPWDQMGYILTGFAVAAPAMLPFGKYLWFYFAFLAGGTFFIHMFVTIIAYFIGWKDIWY
ncbi:MAG: CDP-archaeol synthase, partial [Candidatus Heimdallarchaeaceae archaeon]